MKTGADALIADLEARGLGWSLDHTGNLIEARVWDWPHVVGRYRPHTVEPLEKMLCEAMLQLDWRKYPVKTAIKRDRSAGATLKTGHGHRKTGQKA